MAEDRSGTIRRAFRYFRERGKSRVKAARALFGLAFGKDDLTAADQPPTPEQLCFVELEASADIVRDTVEVVPRFTLFTPSGQLVLFLPLADDMGERLKALELVRLVMVHRQATAFLLAGESIEPNALTCTYIARGRAFSVYRLVLPVKGQKPPHHVAFGPVERQDEVDPLLRRLLPRSGETLPMDQIALAQKIIDDCTVRPEDITRH